ncbi:MAG: ribosomal protein L7/L12 [Deltaproteobacteria bacterium]|nr:ribosomal protein L7/L12 [Deltaproteobacteria bacterium]
METLEQIDLNTNAIGDEGLAELLRSPRVSRLERLEVAGNSIGDSGARTLAEHAPATLRSVDFTFNRIGPNGAAALAGAERLATLDWLALGSNPLTPDGARALIDSAHLHERIKAAIQDRWFAERKTEFDVVVTSAGAKKVQILKAMRAISGWGLMDAKRFLDELPRPLKEGISEVEANRLKGQLEAAGATVELR